MRDLEADALAIYGSLRPGEPNHWVVKSLGGEWLTGAVRGWRFELSWGPAQGYDGFIANEAGNEVAVDVLVSDRLAKHWHEVDDFEGPGYQRVPINVVLDDGREITAQIYEAVPEAE